MYNLYLGGLSCTQVAKQKGLTVSTVCNYFKRYNLKVENRQNLDRISNKELIKRYNNGESLTKIAKDCGSSVGKLGDTLRSLGIEVVNQQNKLRFNENVFDTIDTEEKAYWLGFIFADGYISSQKEGKKKQYKFELTLGVEDIDHLHKFNKFIGYEGDNVKAKPVKYKGNTRMSYR